MKPDEEKNTEFNAYLDSLDDKSTAAVYVQMMSIPTEEQLDASVKEAMNGMTRSDMETSITQALTDQMGMSESDVSDYIADMSDEEITDSFTQMMAEQVKVPIMTRAAMRSIFHPCFANSFSWSLMEIPA